MTAATVLKSLPKDVEKVLNALLAHPRLGALILFGSFAIGRAHPGSDIDLAVAATPPLTRQEYDQLMRLAVEATDLVVDLVDLDQAHAPLLQAIFRDGIWIKRDNEIYFRTLRRALYEAADFLPIKERLQKHRVGKFVK